LSRVVAVTVSVNARIAAGDSLQHDVPAAAADDVGGGDALFDETFLTLRSVGAERQTNMKCHTSAVSASSVTTDVYSPTAAY